MPSFLNPVTKNLKPYPMEELVRIKQELQGENKKIYDFGVGDPKLPLWEQAIKTLQEKAATDSLGYPSIKGTKELDEAHRAYLKKNFSLELSDKASVLPTRGSKEGIFHIALSLIGRAGRKTLAYPVPGYPVYESSALFAGGTPYPVSLTEENNYLMEPWNFPREVQKDLAALWINYPHNPTGKCVSRKHLEKLVSWCQENDVILLSDESYIDLYHESLEDPSKQNERPVSAVTVSEDRVISFYTLSKRSGFTGLRAGFIAGDKRILEAHTKARANFGLSSPLCIQESARVTWMNEEHVKDRRKIMSQRLDLAFPILEKLGMVKEKPVVPFYLWLKIPDKIKEDDISFCLGLAKDGVIMTPGRWLGAQSDRHLRIALTLDKKNMLEAFKLLSQHI